MNKIQEQYNFKYDINDVVFGNEDLTGFTFTLDLSRLSNIKPTNIILKSLASNLYNQPGYMMQLTFENGLFPTPSYFFDGMNPNSLKQNIKYNANNRINTTQRFTIKRLSGDKLVDPPGPGDLDVIVNPSFTFSLVFEYYVDK